MLNDKKKRGALAAAGWTEEREGNGFWTAPVGTAPPTAWSTRRAFWFLIRGTASRALAAIGWDVAPEYVGGSGMSIGDHVLHEVKAPRFITIRAALRREGLPSLADYEAAACAKATP